MANANHLEQKPTSNKNRARIGMFLGVVVLFSAIAFRVHALHQRAEAENPLKGDMDEAVGGLSEELKKTPSDKRLSLLLAHLQDSNAALRYAAIDPLGEYHNQGAADAIEHAYTDSASEVRKRSMEVLQKVDKERGFRLLVAGLKDEDTWIRESAVTQLGQFVRQYPQESRRAIPSLIAALEDKNGTVVPTLAMSVLRKLTGKPWKLTHATPPEKQRQMIANWQNWWKQKEGEYHISPEFTNIAPIRPTRTDPSPDFQVQDVEGKEVSLATQKGRITLLNFWGTWCPPCKVEVPDLEKLHRAYPTQNVDIIGIAVKEDNGANGLKRWCQAQGVTYRQALSTNAIQDAFGHIEEVPVSVLIDQKGRIRYRWEGERDFSTFQAAIERIIRE